MITILRELGFPNPVISFTWGCYRSLSGNRVAPSGAHFLKKFCKKSKGYSRHGQFGLLRDIPKLGPRVQLPLYFGKIVFFFKKTRFFHKTLLWLPRGRRPLRVPLMMPLSMRPGPTLFTFASYTLFHFFVLSWCSLLRRDPRTSFLALFSEAFSDARVYRSPMYLCSKVLFFAT